MAGKRVTETVSTEVAQKVEKMVATMDSSMAFC